MIFSAFFYVCAFGIATWMSRHYWVFVLWMIISGLLCFTFVCVVIGLSHSLVMSVCVGVGAMIL